MDCSISGALIFGSLDNDRARAIEEKIIKIMIKAEERGRDSWGIVYLTRDGLFKELKGVGRASNNLPGKRGFLSKEAIAVIANNRAEPTTEHVVEKGLNDIQPIIGNNIAVTHNGTIANDLDLERRLNIRKTSKIDSSIIPPLLEHEWDGSITDLQRILRDEIVGSYALSIIDKRRPGKMWLATNFKPLYIMWDKELNVLFFSSMDYYLEEPGKAPWESNVVKRINPYSLIEVDINGSWQEVSLWKQTSDRKKKRALVIASGGLDSTTAAAKLRQDGYEVSLLHFNYRHKAENRELEAIRAIARDMNVQLIEIDMDFFKVVGRSPLLGEGNINKSRGGEAGAEFAHEWVPARNFVFIALATAIAEAWGYDVVATGVNLEESGAYPDNEMEFIRLLNNVLPYATGPQKRVELVMPVGNLVKHEIVKLGLETNAPLEYTWSCYEDGEKHCGVCGPCYMRRIAFKINGVKDPVEYNNSSDEEEKFWRGTRPYQRRMNDSYTSLND